MFIKRNLKKAREAYKKKDVEATIEAHKSASEQHKKEGKYIKSVVYGGLDGIVTTFAIVAGVTGAALNAGIVLILGFANLIADGISMGIGDYISAKSEKEFQKNERKREEWEVYNYPEGEKKEMMEIYSNKGILKKDASKLVSILSKYKKAWVDVMMLEELEIVENKSSPFRNGLATFTSFVVFGFVPLISYFMAQIFNFNLNTFIIAGFLTGITLFILGALKAKITGRKWFVSGLEMLIVGGIAAIAAYLIGNILSKLI
ncbi:VIT1/CCC1 transporter family protein [Candidatus Pacearchaeota archaeon]|nr:VIT1/CCC1 transporter family protein [Candidatus Pacearchaeota archaeon]